MMKRFFSRIAAAVITGVMLVSSAVPAMAEELDVQAPQKYEDPISNGTVEIYAVDEDGNKLDDKFQPKNVNLETDKFARVEAQEIVDNKYFSRFEYVTPARKYIASYNPTFTFYVDPPMTIEIVYTSSTDTVKDKNTVSGMYKAPVVDGDKTYFYGCVAASKDIKDSPMSITFGRSMHNAGDSSDANNNSSETFETDKAQNIYYTDGETGASNTFQYIVSSAIQTGGPINFEAVIDGDTARIMTWDFSTAAFGNAKEKDTINGLTIQNGNITDGKLTGEVFFKASEGDKVRIEASGTPTVNGGTKSNSKENIYEYTVTDTNADVYVNGTNISRIQLNPMDDVMGEGSPSPETPKAEIGTITVNVTNSSTVKGVQGTPVLGATVNAVKNGDDQFKFTIPEIGNGKYSTSAPKGTYDITVELNSETATGTATVESGENVNVNISILDIEAERQKKVDTLISYMMTEDGPQNGSLWNTENNTELKWSYINGCMMTAMMDLYEVTNDKEYLEFAEKYQSGFISNGESNYGSNKDQTVKKGNILKSTTSNNKTYIALNDLSNDSTLDNVNPGKAILDVMEAENLISATDNKFYLCTQNVIKNIVNNAAKKRIDKTNFYHKSTYPCQIWLDGTYMALPYIIQYKRLYPDENYEIAGNTTVDAAITDVVEQFKNIEKKMKDSTGLYYHGYDAHADSKSSHYNANQSDSTAMSWAKGADTSKYTDTTKRIYWVNDGKKYSEYIGEKNTASKEGCSGNFWSRAMGWFAMALVDSYEQIDLIKDGNYDVQKQTLKQIYTDLMNSVINYQDPETGMWYQVMNQKDKNKNSEPNYEKNYLESSGTATFAAALMKGYNLGMVSETRYYDAGLKAFNALTDKKLTVTGTKAGLKDICKSAGLAGNKNNEAQNHTTKFAVEKNGETSVFSSAADAHLLRDGSFDYYLSEPIVENDAKGAAPYLMAYAQKLKHDKEAKNN